VIAEVNVIVPPRPVTLMFGGAGLASLEVAEC
jgi:hypothetical protein